MGQQDGSFHLATPSQCAGTDGVRPEETANRGDASAWSVVPGDVLAGKYTILRPVGRGGMGQVFEARHLTLGRRYALKVMAPRLDRRQDLIARFRREAVTAAKLEHENVAAVLDMGETSEGLPFLVMEYLLGEDLGSLMTKEGPLPPSRAARLIVQACRGVDAIHGAGAIHRDLKPTNLFVCRHADGRDLVKVLDLGIAKAPDADPNVEAVTRSGAVLGTPHYMAPEQARGERGQDRRVDVYALGAILYECLCGHRAHPGASYNEILYHVMTKQPQPLRELQPDLPDAIVAVVERAMAQDQDARFSSATAMASELLLLGSSDRLLSPTEETLAGTPPDGSLARLKSLPHTSPDAIHGGSQAIPLRRSVTRRATVVGMALVLAGLLTGWIGWSAHGSGSSIAVDEHALAPAAEEIQSVACFEASSVQPLAASATAIPSSSAAVRSTIPQPPAAAGNTRRPAVSFARENPYE